LQLVWKKLSSRITKNLLSLKLLLL